MARVQFPENLVNPNQGKPEEGGDLIVSGSAITTSTCCFSCFKVLEMYQQRHLALVFQSEQNQEQLKALSTNQPESWTEETLKYLLNIYRGVSMGKLQKVRKRRIDRALLLRAGSASSVTRKSTFCQPITETKSSLSEVPKPIFKAPKLKSRNQGFLTDRSREPREAFGETPQFATQSSAKKPSHLRQRSLSNRLHQGLSSSISSKNIIIPATKLPKAEEILRENGDFQTQAESLLQK